MVASLTITYQWFGTYNFLDENLPCPHTFLQKLGRQAFIGFCASAISDTVSNSLRVVKTYRQVNETRISYFAAMYAVIEVDGVKGLFGRGLKTRILANGLQGLMFSILWKLFLDLYVQLTFIPGFPFMLTVMNSDGMKRRRDRSIRSRVRYHPVVTCVYCIVNNLRI